MTQVEYVGYFILGLAFLISLIVGILQIVKYIKEPTQSLQQVVQSLQVVVGKLDENVENQTNMMMRYDKRLSRVESKQQAMEVNCARQGHYIKIRDET
jgi:membrane protein implicated in regulation of membrane protease activity